MASLLLSRLRLKQLLGSSFLSTDKLGKELSTDLAALNTEVVAAQADADGAQAAADAAAATADAAVIAGAAGYKLARGTITPTAASETVVTGLTTVVAAVAGFKGAPTLTHMFVEADIGDQAGTPDAGEILIRSKKPTAADNVTPTDASDPWSAIDWVAVGT